MNPARWLYTARLRLRSLFRRTRVEEELDEEFRFHLEYRISQEIAAGKSADEARYAAIRAMDGMAQRKEECRDTRRVDLVSNLAQDVRYAWRTLRKSPGFTAAALVTLALGIGATSAIFSVVNAALLRPLPYPRPGRLVLLFEVIDEPQVTSFANFLDWQRRSHSFAAMAAGRQNSFNLSGSGWFQPERVDGAIFSWQLFQTLGVQPVIGRAFQAGDDRVGAPPVAVISYGLWQRRFGGSGDILRRSIRLDGVDRQIVGVMARGFGYPVRETELWVPIQTVFGPDLATSRGWHQMYAIGRIREGIPIARATAEVNAIQKQLVAENPGALIGHGATCELLSNYVARYTRTALYILLGAVVCLLLIACVNISNLLVARGSQRAREFSIRVSLGASPARLVQQLLTESLLLAIIGAAMGLALAYGLTETLGLRTIMLIRELDIDTSAPVEIEWRVLAFTMGVSLIAGIAAGLLPALESVRGSTSRRLKEGGRTATPGRRQQRLRTGLISAEVALSLVLLIGAGLMIRSLAALERVPTGVRVQNLLTAGISLPDSRYGDRTSVARFYQVLLDNLRKLPGVRAAALVNYPPVAGYWSDNTFEIEGRPLPRGQYRLALNRSATPEYFHVAGIPLLAGRTFTDHDGRGLDDKHPRRSAVIISKSMARKFWPGENPLGKRIYFGDDKSPRYEIIGIVGDVRIHLAQPPLPTMYVPASEGGHTDFYAVLDVSGEPSSLTSAVRKAAASIDPDIPAHDIRTMAQIVGESSATRSFTAVLFGSFAALAMVLSAIGLYGVLSYLTAQRTAEMGIRMALGAGRAEVCGLVLVQGLRPACAGILIGLIGAAALTRTMRSVLFGVASSDVLTFVLCPIVLIVVAATACVVPGWRAARIDPVDALRSE